MRRQPPWVPPHSGKVGGFVPLRLELARTAEHVVLLGAMSAHPEGVELSLQTRTRGARFMLRRMPDEGDGAMRFGVSFADGRSTEQGRWPSDDDAGDGPILYPAGGSGGGDVYRQSLWLWPLPPPGPLTFHLLWEDAGIAETSTSVDAAVFIEAAARAETLWEPLSPEEEREHARAMHRRFSSGSGFSMGTVRFAHHKDEETGPSVEE